MPTGACKWNHFFLDKKEKKNQKTKKKNPPCTVCNSYTQAPRTHKVVSVALPGMRRRAPTDQFNLSLSGVAWVAGTGPAGLMWRTVTLWWISRRPRLCPFTAADYVNGECRFRHRSLQCNVTGPELLAWRHSGQTDQSDRETRQHALKIHENIDTQSDHRRLLCKHAVQSLAAQLTARRPTSY